MQQSSNFSDHGYFLDGSKDTILGNQLHLMKGTKWHQMRATLGPAFEEKNVAQMCSLIRTNSLDLVHFLATVANTEQDSRDFFQKHTFNVMAYCAFGLGVNCFKNDMAKFSEIHSLVFDQNPMTPIKTMLFYLFPSMMRKLKVRMMKEEVVRYILGTIRSSGSTKDNSNCCNMIQFLNRVKHGEVAKQEWTDEELVAQSVSFFGNGFEYVVNLLSFAAYELTANPEVQEKLFTEIRTISEDCPLTQESVSKMAYLDMVIDETLRKWPAFPTLERVCTDDYELNDGDRRLLFRRGDTLCVSTWALHHDENYFPEPERFDPERFSETNKKMIGRYTYLPFGIGPRNCIGNYNTGQW